jgi:superfamily II DNA/RNA helicase
MTLVGYFNSLRELGGSRRIVEDEVYSQLRGRGGRLRVGEQTGLFADREIQVEAVELTSRESTSKVSRAKERLAKDFTQKDDRVDVAIATNMISVGLDISRLGLMAVFGQPKTTAEYIQATSRVGRQEDKPGLIVTMMNVHKPRDRSHYERFEAYHATFYRSVEAASVTPFSPRALDRGIAEVIVALARQSHNALTRSESAIRAEDERPKLSDVVDIFGQRVEAHAVMSNEESDERRGRVRAKVEDLLDDWAKIAHVKHDKGSTLRYQEFEAGTGPYLLRTPLDPELERVEKIERQFKAHRSLRDVEPATNLWLKQLNGIEIEAEEVD